jgi:hypothetical protein
MSAGSMAVDHPPLQQSSSSAVATYTNGDYSHPWTASYYPEDRMSQTGSNSGASSTHLAETTLSRPGSRGASSSVGHSQPTTSHDTTAGIAIMNLSSNAVVVARPESSGNDGPVQPAMRHGFAEAYSSEEYLTMLEQVISPPLIW